MDEKILIKSEKYNINGIIGKIMAIGCFCGIFYAIAMATINSTSVLAGFGFVVLSAIISLIIYLCISKIDLTITDKRAYGCALFGKRVDLPLDSISAVGLGMFKSIAITTASGAIKFAFIKNRDEMYNAISKLLLDRQTATKNIIVQETNNNNNASNADELKKFKDLLDSGVITQEEFDAKKKQLLGL